ncbi:MAG: tetratricopeptide repeat protein, partial [Planctomycetes bacterium]|nr:tetratricopeptide repeat protein [Planctomycetota bacterium]
MTHRSRAIQLVAATLWAVIGIAGLSSAASIEPGDWVVTVADGVPVKLGTETRFVLAKGTELAAGKTKDQWTSVIVMKAGQKVHGWVKSSQLALLGYEPHVRGKLVGELAAVSADKQYVAFSLQAARKQLETAAGRGDAAQRPASPNASGVDPEVACLGGITSVRGLVVDPKTGDAIVVGQYVPGCQRLTLDDLAVTLRARFVHGQWPVVSIDPPATRQEPAYHNVRFEGGVRDTAFGLTLYEADYLLKKIGLGHVATGVRAVPSEWDLWLAQAQAQYGSKEVNIGGRVWFFPILGATPVRENVAAYSGLKVGVFYEVLSARIDGRQVKDLTDIKSSTGEQFVSMVRKHYEPLAAQHPSWRRIQQLNELVALTRAIEVMEHRPDLSWWLESYPVTPVETPRQAKELSRSKTTDHGSYRYTASMEGGVELRAMALRLDVGDVSALADAALSTRPAPDALTWGFVADEWLIAIPPDKDIAKGDEVTPQLVYAQFLTRQGKVDEALTRVDKILAIEPNYLDALLLKGTLLSDHLQRPADAIDCFDALLAKLPESTEALVARGLARLRTNDFFQASEDFDSALQINPRLADALAYRGICRGQRGEFDEAVADLTAAIQLAPEEAMVRVWRGNIYRAMADQEIVAMPAEDGVAPELPEELPLDADVETASTDAPMYAPSDAPMPAPPEPPAPPDAGQEELLAKALADFNEAIRRNSKIGFAFASRGRLYQARREHDKALADLTQAIQLEPTDLSYYLTRAQVLAETNQSAKAVADYSEILNRDPQQSEIRWQRSELYRKLRQFDKALAD